MRECTHIVVIFHNSCHKGLFQEYMPDIRAVAGLYLSGQKKFWDGDWSANYPTVLSIMKTVYLLCIKSFVLVVWDLFLNIFSFLVEKSSNLLLTFTVGVQLNSPQQFYS